MRADIKRRTIRAILCVLTIVTLAWSVPNSDRARAEEPALDTGTIYYFDGTGMARMDPDGSNKSAVSAAVNDYCEPSTLPHDGRWFLQADEVSSATYPDGRARLELFAVHASGSPRIRLTDGRVDASTFLEPNNRAVASEGGRYAMARWLDRDRKVSYLAVRTIYDAQGNRTVQSGGLYRLTVDPDDLADHTAVAMSGSALLSMPLNTAGTMIRNPNYDWKPDGSSVVFWVPNGQTMTRGMWRADATSSFSSPTLLTTSDASDFRWSPDGSTILFNGGLLTGIKSIRPDGTGETLLVADPSDGKFDQAYLRDLDWSPSGTHIVFGYYTYNSKKNTGTGDVYRATSSGSGATDLTANTSSGCHHPRWRSDGSPPDVSITQPSDDAEVWGTVTIRATATDDGSITEVEFFVDGTSIGTDTTSPYEVTWDSTDVLDGDHAIEAVATDDDDETSTDSIAVTVENVDDPPEVTLTAPDANDTVSGDSVAIAATASDDGYVTKVEFFVDGSLVGTDTTSPFGIAWDSTGVQDGSHTITAKATDDASKTSTDGVAVTVRNAPDPLTVTSISPSSVRAGSSVSVTVRGTGFASGATLSFANGSGPSVTVSGTTVVNATTITASVRAAKTKTKGAWTWDVVVTNSASSSASLVDGFTVTR